MATIVGLTFKSAVPDDEAKFICPHCGKEYKTEEGLNKHIAEKHPDGAAKAE